MDLRDKLKFWMALSNYVDMIVRGTSPLSLPDAIADSLSYVKAFGGTEQRNIPQPYTQVNYVTNTASTAVDTGVMIDFAKNYEFEVECRAVSGSWYILQSRASASGNVTGIHGETSGSNIKLVVGNVTVCTSAITRTVGNKLYVKATLNAGVATLYVKDETANTEDTQTGSYGTTQPNPTAAVYLLGNAGGQYVDVNSDIYMARIKENDTVVMDYVPARQVATAGFYDKASGTFKTALTPANLSADGNTVPTPDAPMDIWCNNGVIKAKHQSGLPLEYELLEYIRFESGPMLRFGIDGFDDDTSEIHFRWKTDDSVAASNYTTGIRVWENNNYRSWRLLTYLKETDRYYIFANSSSGAVVNITRGQFHDIVIKSGSYTIDGTTTNVSIDSQKTPSDWVLETSSAGLKNYFSYVKIKRQGQWIANFVTVRRLSDNRLGFYDLINSNFISKESITATAGPEVSDPVVVYADGTVETIKDSLNNTATAEMLLKVDDYQDEQEILSGAITRNVGVKVLDGTEGFGTPGNNVVAINKDAIGMSNAKNSGMAISSHFILSAYMPAQSINNGFFITSNDLVGFSTSAIGNTAAAVNDWLAAQYNAGTPVIIVYQLETPTTESVAGQTLQVTGGDNVLEITQASLNNLELEAKYKKEA